MGLTRTASPAAFEAVANDPRVRAGLGFGTAPLALGALLADPSNLAFGDADGGFIFEALGEGRYELHTLLSGATRGRAALDLAAQAIARVFTETSAAEIVTRTPGNLRHAALMARWAGFAPVRTLDDAWPGPDGPTSLTFYSLSRAAWTAREPLHDNPETIPCR